MDELLPIVDVRGNVQGSALRSHCHNYSFLLHPVVHLHLFNTKGELCLQKRAYTKDIQPDKWDTAVGGHVSYNEPIEVALQREAQEELGITGFLYQKAFSYAFRSEREYELVNAFVACYDGQICFDSQEISEVRFWTFDEIKGMMGNSVFTPNFEQEFDRLIQYLRKEDSFLPNAFNIKLRG